MKRVPIQAVTLVRAGRCRRREAANRASWAAGLGDLLLQGSGRLDALLETELDGFQHDVFGELVRAGFDHRYGIRGTSEAQLKLRFLELLGGGVEDELAVDVAHFGRADGAREGQVGEAAWRLRRR